MFSFSFSEDSFVVATVSRRLPQPTVSDPSLSLDIGMDMSMPGSSQSEPTAFNDWERLGDDAILELTEARLGTIDGSSQLSERTFQ